jgi:hypothetical protein
VITLTCDNCDKPFEVDDDALAGEKVSCPYCGDITRVPERVAAPVPRGKPVSSAPEGPMPARGVSQTAQEAEEHEVLVVRQAMFRAHPLLYSFMVLLVLSGLGFAIAAIVNTAWWRGYVWVGLSVMFIGLAWWLVWWAAPHRWVKLIVTNKRTIRQEGIIQRRTSEVLHRHIMNVQIRQTVLQRVLGVGSIAIDSAAGSGSDAFGQRGDTNDNDKDDYPAPPGVEIEMNNVAKPYDVKAVIDRYRGI